MAEESQFNIHGYNIVTILKRLEAATSRLEDITIFQQEASDVTSPKDKSTANTSNAEVNQKTSSKKESVPSQAEIPKLISAFKEYIDSYITPFIQTSKEIDPIVGEAAEELGKAFEEEKKFLEIVAITRKPDPTDPAYLQLFSPINRCISKINDIKEANRKSKFFNHLSTISEGSAVLGWIATETPVSIILDFKDSSQFWSNRIMKEYKGDEKQTEWVKQFLGIFEPLSLYAKEYHTTGPSWNKRDGKLLKDVLSSSNSDTATAPSGGVPPPPPPPLPPATIFEEETPTQSSTGGMNAVFAQLNKGENITSGLKKVDKSAPKKPPAVPKKPAASKKPSNLSTGPVPKSKPPRKELVDGSKWMIENYTADDVQLPIIIDAEMNHSIYIGNCDGLTVQVKGKANAISISETRKTGVVVDSLISGIDIIKSYKFGVQVTGSVGVISIDKSDEGSIYLSKEAAEADPQVFTSCTTALNINLPKDDDFIEVAAPEQIKHTVKNGKLHSEIFEHAG
ncbi:uncharacterized protein PRCAT00001709001 [Priceomyces carsonii]|uniref:uncharacterized protein n=1 Tax=Priceomyces carsonii TaxID=28549 RepID=UPI002ED9D76F|nr:unnamed protein product [Priceomyces carsonii]